MTGDNEKKLYDDLVAGMLGDAWLLKSCPRMGGPVLKSHHSHTVDLISNDGLKIENKLDPSLYVTGNIMAEVYEDINEKKRGWLLRYGDAMMAKGEYPDVLSFVNPQTSKVMWINCPLFVDFVLRSIGARYAPERGTFLPLGWSEKAKKELKWGVSDGVYGNKRCVLILIPEVDVRNANLITKEFSPDEYDGFETFEYFCQAAHTHFLEKKIATYDAKMFAIGRGMKYYAENPAPVYDKATPKPIVVATKKAKKVVVAKEEDIGEFCHLHVHSQYSLLDGVPSNEDIALKAKALGHPGIALTDHGYMFGSYKHQQACNDVGIKAIHGCEFYFVDDRKNKEDRWYYHLIVLAMNDAGWKNLIMLNSLAGKEGFYYKPRIDWELLSRYNDGLIVLSGCYRSPVSWHFSVEGRNFDKAVENMRKFKAILGDRFYNEVMQIDWDEYDSIVPEMIEVAHGEGIQTVVTNDCHYANEDDSKVQSTMLKIATGGGNGQGLEFHADSFYLKPRREMMTGPITNDMMDRTLEICDRVTFKLEFSGYKFPHFDITQSSDYVQFYSDMVKEGVIQKGEPCCDKR